MMERVKKIEDFDISNYTHIDNELPKEDGVYDTIVHSGSISISYYKTPKLFRRGSFPRMDWDYVIMWKEQE